MEPCSRRPSNRSVPPLAEDTGTQAASEAWEAFLAYYGVLSSMAERSPELAAELQTVVDFMATGPCKKPATPDAPTKGTGPA